MARLELRKWIFKNSWRIPNKEFLTPTNTFYNIIKLADFNQSTTNDCGWFWLKTYDDACTKLQRTDVIYSACDIE